MGNTSSESNDPESSPRLVRVRHLLVLGAWALALAIVGSFFTPLKNVLLGFLATAAVASALHPLMRLAPGPRTLRAVVVGLLPVLLIAAMGLGAWALLRKPIAEEVRRLPQARDAINQTLAGWSQRVGLAEPLTLSSVARSASDAVTGGGGASLFAGITQFIGGVLIALALILFGSLYLLAEDNEKTIVGPFQKLLPPRRREPFAAALRDVVPRLRWWLIGALSSMAIVGLASSLGYWLVGVELAIPLGLITGFSEIVPTIGPASSFVLGLVVAAGSGGKAVAGVIGVYAFVQVLESYILQPLIMRKAVEMPPVITLFSVIWWGQVFGAPGLILAIPINIVLWAFVYRLVIEPDEARQHATELVRS